MSHSFQKVGSHGSKETPLILLHGVGLDRTMWREFESVSPRPTLSLDLPGHGQQPHLQNDCSLADLAADVRGRIPFDEYYLLGFSLGALVAQQIVITASQGIKGLICVSSVCKRSPSERESVLKRLSMAEHDFQSSVSASIERWYPTNSGVSEEIVAATKRTLQSNDVDSFVRAYRVFANGDEDVADQLANIKVPVLAVTGENDPGSSPAMTHRLVDSLPDAEGIIVPEARHMLPVTHPNVLADLVETFISRIEAQ